MTDTNQPRAPEQKACELKPCPFCGCENIAAGIMIVGCEACGASAKRRVWNTRAAIPPQPSKDAAVEEVDAVLRAYLYNPHCATTIAEGRHAAAGFCQTCADRYTAGQAALSALERMKQR